MSGARRRFLATATAVLLGLTACTEAPAPPPPTPPLECPVGMVAEGDRCAWALPAASCPPDTHARVGEDACQPIGAGPCADPFQSDGAWSCRERAPEGSCAPGEAAFLGETACRAVGWSPCPEGFVVESHGCRPLLAMGCAGAEREAVGREACAPVGDCARGPLVADRYVDAAFTGAQVDATHFTTISAAVSAAGDGETVAIAAGRYAETVTLRGTTTLVGACPARTRIVGGVIAATAGSAVTVENLSISGDRPGLHVARGAHLVGRDLAIEATLGVGVLLVDVGSAAQLEDVVIRDVRSLPDGSDGRGINVEEGALSLTRGTISGCRDVGIIAVGPGAEIALDQVVVLDTVASTSGRGGHALVAAAGGRIEGTTVVARGTRDIGVLSYLAPSVIALDRAYISETGRGGSGAGARADSGGALSLAHASVVDATAVGVMIDDATSTASVSSAWIARVRPDPSTAFSAGLATFARGRAHADDVAVEEASVGIVAADAAVVRADNVYVAGRPGSIGALAQDATLTIVGSTLVGHPAGGAVAEPGAQLTLDRTLVRGFDAGDSGDAPSAAVFAGSATLTIERSAIVGGTGFGVVVNGADGVARIHDTLVRGQRSNAGVIGQGIIAEDARLELDRVRIQDIGGLGVLVQGPAELSRTTVHRITASRRQNGAALALGGAVVVRDVAVVQTQLAGVVLGGGRIDIDGLLVAETAPNDDDEYGHAFLGEGTTVLATHLELRASAAAGLAMDASTARITRSLVVGNAVGAHAQGGSMLVERADPPAEPPLLEIVFGSDVLLLDNATRLGVGTIPLPDPFAIEH